MSLFIRLLLLVGSLFLQWDNAALRSQSSPSFPDEWTGVWQGELQIFKHLDQRMTVPMELHLLPTDSSHRFDWTIVYGTGDRADRREYALIVVDAERGHYVVDEQNGILLDGYFHHQTFFSQFEVMGSWLLTTEQLAGDSLIFEVVAGPFEPVRVSGDTIIGTDTIPPVQSFNVATYQRAVLRRRERN